MNLPYRCLIMDHVDTIVMISEEIRLSPEEIPVVNDLLPGVEMARAPGMDSAVGRRTDKDAP